MTIHEYKLTSPKIKGEIVFTYHAGHLHTLLFKLSTPLTEEQWMWLFANVFYKEQTLLERDLRMGKIELQRITPQSKSPAMEKVRMFQELYLQHVGIEYIKQAKDHLMIAKKDVTPELLTTYFTSNNVSFKKHHSIGNFCRFYQELCAEAAGAYNESTQRFPNHYSSKFEAGLNSKELGAYWKHLKGLGWSVKIIGNVSEWTPPQPTNGKKQEA